MTDDDPRGRLERALDRVPLISERVDAEGLDWLQANGERVIASAQLPDVMVDALAALPAEQCAVLSDLRFVVAALEAEYLPPLDMTLMRAVTIGCLSEAIGRLAVAMSEHNRPSIAVTYFSEFFYDLLDDS